jgi:hypothetical protein
VVVDEIDAHVHIDLQHTVLPKLIKMFPKIQFIISSHSPMFVLGMEKEFGTDAMRVVEMPSKITVSAETYTEFGRALDLLTATKAFSGKVISEIEKSDRPIVFVEGETDAPYLLKAAELYRRHDIVDGCYIEWTGAKDDGGQGFHTGKNALDHTLSVLRANPDLVKRQTLLLYDNDAQKRNADYDRVHVRVLHTSATNEKVRAGIENLLLEAAILPDDYQEVETVKPNGDITNRKTLRKSYLCQRICDLNDKSNFESFGPVLDTIGDFIRAAMPV